MKWRSPWFSLQVESLGAEKRGKETEAHIFSLLLTRPVTYSLHLYQRNAKRYYFLLPCLLFCVQNVDYYAIILLYCKMTRKCCIQGCCSNYRGTKYTSSIRFLKCVKLKEFWLRKIPRANFDPNNNSVVCVSRSHESDIVSNENAFDGYSKIMKLKRKCYTFYI